MTIYVSTSWEKNMISAHTCKEQAQLQERIAELEAERDRYKEALEKISANFDLRPIDTTPQEAR